MGGNALKQGSVRMDRDTYNAVKNFVKYKLPDGKVEAPLSYLTKPSFGDVDIIYTGFATDDSEKVDSFLKRAFNATEIFRNGPCISFDFHNPGLGVGLGEGNGVQVDLIKVNSEYFDFAFNYYSYNDLGCLVGTIARACGFKFGHEGLFYRYNHNDKNNINFVPVTKCFDTALELMGFEEFEEFETLEDIFEYVARSKYFDPNLFRLDSLNHVNRVRNAKRPVYMQFLNWLEIKLDGQLPEPVVIDRESILKEAMLNIAGFESEFADTMQTLFTREKVKEVFNGTLVSEWTGETGKNLGLLMKAIRDSYVSEALLNRDALYNLERLKANVIHLNESL